MPFEFVIRSAASILKIPHSRQKRAGRYAPFRDDNQRLVGQGGWGGRAAAPPFLPIRPLNKTKMSPRTQ
jgi:hypothetical protein